MRPSHGLRWGLRRYRWATAAAAVIVVGLVVVLELALTPAARFEAEAVVAARSLTIDPMQLPRLADTIFDHGDVLELAAREPGSPFDLEGLQRSVGLVPVEENIALLVVGSADDPNRAAAAANAVAGALVTELNRLGPGVGVFTLHTSAQPPEEPAEGVSSIVLAGVGVTAAVLFALGLVGVLVVAHDPVVSAERASDVAGAPILGILRLHGDQPGPDSVGLDDLVARLYPQRDGRVRFVEVAGEDDRALVAPLVAAALAETGPVRYVGGELPTHLASERLVVVDDPAAMGDGTVDGPVVVGHAGVRILAAPGLISATPTVIVVCEGAPADGVHRARRRLHPDQLLGIVYATTDR